MRAVNRAASFRDAGQDAFRYSKIGEAVRGSDDVDDRIDGANLMKVHFLKVLAVDLRFGLRDDAEDPGGEIPYGRIRKAVKDRKDFREISVGVIVRMPVIVGMLMVV